MKGEWSLTDNQWIHLTHEDSSKKSIEYYLNNKKSLFYLRTIHRNSEDSDKIRNDGIHDHPLRMEKSTSFIEDLHVMSNLFWGVKCRQAVFFPTSDPNDNIADDGKSHDDYVIPQNVRYKTYWKRKQDAVCLNKLSRAQDQGMQFLQTKSLTIFILT